MNQFGYVPRWFSLKLTLVKIDKTVIEGQMSRKTEQLLKIHWLIIFLLDKSEKV